MDFSKLMKQAQKMQANIATAQEELAKLTVEGTSGGGAVKVTSNGHGDILTLKIEPDAVDVNDIEMLEDLVLAAIKDAIQKSKDVAAKKMNSVTGGLGGGFPGLM